MVEERLGQRRPLRRVRAGAQLVEQHQRPRAGVLDDPDDRAQVPRERRQGLGDRLLVADVREHVAQHRQLRAGRGRDVEAGLVHEAQEPDGAQGDGLAAGVGAGDHERRVAVAEPEVDRDDATGEPGMARGQQHDLGPVGGLGADAVELGRQVGLGRPEVELGQRPERLEQQRAVGADERRQLVEDPALLLVDGRLGLAPGVAQLDDHQRLDEQRLAAARRVVDDALDLGPRLGPDRDHVPAVAERHDRLLERAAELRPDERVQPPAEPVVGDADRGPERAEAGRGGVEELAGGVEAAGERAAQRGQRVQPPAEVAQEGAPLVGEGGREARRRVERLHDLEELLARRGGRRASPARSTARCRAPRRSRPRAAPGSARGPGRSRRAPGRRGRDRPTARAPRRGAATGRTRCARPGGRGRPGTRAGRSSGRPSRRSGRRVGGDAAAQRRAVRGDEPPRDGDPRLPGVGDADPGGRRAPPAPARRAAAPRGAAADAASHRSTPVCDRSMSKAAATRPGPAARRASRGAHGAAAPGARAPRACASTPSTGSTARI